MVIFIENINKKTLYNIKELAIFFKKFGKIRASNILSYHVINNFDINWEISKDSKKIFHKEGDSIDNINVLHISKNILENLLKKENLPKNESILLDIIKEFLNMYKDYDYLSINDVSQEIIDLNIKEDLISNQINIYEKHLCKNHIDTIMLYEELSFIKYKQQNYIEAEKYILKVINYFMENSFANTESFTSSRLLQMTSNSQFQQNKMITILAALENLANILFKQEKYEKAKRIYEAVIICFESKENINKKTLSCCYENYAKLCEKLENYQESENFYRKVLDLIIENFPSDEFSEENIYETYFNIAATLESQNKYTEAASNYEEALEGFERIYDVNDMKIFECYNYLGDIYYKLNRYEESLKYLKKSLITCSEIYGIENRNCDLILKRINLCNEKINLWKTRQKLGSV
jgi:tetratricopeptide (TPR) repeat protein